MKSAQKQKKREKNTSLFWSKFSFEPHTICVFPGNSGVRCLLINKQRQTSRTFFTVSIYRNIGPILRSPATRAVNKFLLLNRIAKDQNRRCGGAAQTRVIVRRTVVALDATSVHVTACQTLFPWNVCFTLGAAGPTK